MTNIYLIQLVGILTLLLGMIALTVTAREFGRPLTRDEKIRSGRDGNREIYRLPFRLETLVGALIFLIGLGILTWSKFDACRFGLYWLPGLKSFLQVMMNCR